MTGKYLSIAFFTHKMLCLSTCLDQRDNLLSTIISTSMICFHVKDTFTSIYNHAFSVFDKEPHFQTYLSIFKYICTCQPLDIWNIILSQLLLISSQNLLENHKSYYSIYLSTSKRIIVKIIAISLSQFSSCQTANSFLLMQLIPNKQSFFWSIFSCRKISF